MMSKPEIQYYEGPAARCSDQKLVVAFENGRLLDLHYTGNPMWRYCMSAGRVFRCRIGYRVNARGDKWLIQSLAVLNDKEG